MNQIAIDIGGTNIKAALINENQEIKDYKKISTPDNVQTLIIDEVYQLAHELITKHKLDKPHIGISSAGVVDSELGEIVYTGPTIKNFDGTNFRRSLKDLYSSMTVHNDVDAALLGELSLNDYEENNIFCLTLGTGIGGAFYNQQLGVYGGARYRANEIGYLLYRDTDQKTFEQRASTSALKALMQERDFQYGTDVPKLFELAQTNDKQSQAILEEWATYVAEGIAQIQIIYDPGLILIGGGISSQGENLIQYIEPKINQFLPPNYGHAPIQTTKTENHAALFGAITEG